MKITIIELYPEAMNLYGDSGNVLTLKRRLEWRGFEIAVQGHDVGDATDFSHADIIVGGGGQDSSQNTIQTDLLSHAIELRQLVEDGVPMLMICGAYQLFGRAFITDTGETIQGVHILPVETKAGNERLVGNIIIESKEFGTIVGYENHSGQTILDKGAQPLGQVIQGAGNNGSDGHEGIRYHNLIGTYLHGPLLPKNPRIADFLIAKALERKGHTEQLAELDIDKIAQSAHDIARNRKR
jgi:CobQ-like glutamine amidotransferase family enzyme